MSDLNTLVVRVSLGRGTSLGRVVTKKLTWEKFLSHFDRENVLVDTACTFAQYAAMSQDEKGKKKRAAGNWLPTLFREGRRKLTHIKGRTMVVFDLDYVTLEQLENIRLGVVPISDFAWAMHTTRSHSPEEPRVRLTLPTNRMMTLDECNAMTRYLACQLAIDPDEGIEIPDIVSMRPNQVMYLPSISRDQEYWTDRNDGAVLDVDAFLAERPDWWDHSTLPHQKAETDRGTLDPLRKMENPTEKQGVIGAWCRTYDVEEAIAEFLPDIYTPGDDGGSDTRYTYALGSGSNGAVVYDEGQFLHSNHGTDPIDGSVNSWDLVRIHKFGHLDKDTRTDAGASKLPSFKAMAKFAGKDDAVANEMYAARAALGDPDSYDDEEEDEELNDLLGPPPESGEPENKPKKKKKADMSWTKHFRRKANGDLEPVLNNITLICQHDPHFAGVIGFNEFTRDPVCLRPLRAEKISLPSRELRPDEKKRGRRWEDADDASISLLATADDARLGWETDFSDAAIQKAVLAAGAQNPQHPVKDDIEECWRRWKAEGSPTGHMDRLAIDYFGCPDTIFHRESSTEFLVGAVARIYEPGCKFDHMLILEGSTGAGKSAFTKILSMGHQCEFRVDLDRIDRVVENMRGTWWLEMAEMAKAKHADANLLKDFLSAQVDKIRLAYGRREMEFPRQSVMIGTSNENDYLSDPTSVRRYWVWKIAARYGEFNVIDLDRLRAERHLIWGETYQTYLDRRAVQRHGELRLGLKSHEAIREQRQIAEGSRRPLATEVISEVIQEWLDEPTPASETEPGVGGFGDETLGETPMVRNMVTSRECFEVLRGEPMLAPYPHADSRTFGQALKLLSGWTEVGRVRRHKRPAAIWFYRDRDGPLWVPASDVLTGGDPGIDDLLD